MARGNYRFPGIYLITNLVDGKVYVGSSLCVGIRLNNHKNQLCRNVHHSRHLSGAVAKYGFDSFTFELWERTEARLLPERETYWLQHFEATNPDYGYNVVGDTTLHCRGIPKSAEHKAKLSKARQKQRTFVDPSGNTVVVDNLIAFCELNNLDYASMNRVAEGSRAVQHKGWRAFDSENVGKPYDFENARLVRAEKSRDAGRTRSRTVKLITPETEVIEIKGIKTFCDTPYAKSHSVNPTGLFNLINGKTENKNIKDSNYGSLKIR